MILNKRHFYYLVIVISIIAVNTVVWVMTGNLPWKSVPFNSYSLQAQSWLEGRLDLGKNYSYLELAIYKGKYYVSFPPFPTVVVFPFVLLFNSAPESMINVFFVIVSGIYAFKIAQKMCMPDIEALFFSLFLVVGSNLVFLTTCGWVWFIAQTMAFAFSLMSFYYAITDNKAHSALSLFLLACAFGCRPFQIIYTPLIMHLFFIRYRKYSLSVTGLILHLLKSSVPALILGGLYMLLNYLRFNNPFEFGHNYLPEFVEAAHGQFSFEYFKSNVHLLFRLPKIENGSFVFPTHNGVAFWLVSPIFLIYPLNLFINATFGRKQRNNGWIIHTIIFLSVVMHLAVTCFHKTMGGWHFGNRYTVDVLPAVFLGIAYLRTRRTNNIPLLVLYIALFMLGVVVNVYGTIKIF